MNKKYYETIFQIIRTGHWITDQVSKELKEFGITEPQFNVLRILRGAKGKPISVSDVLERMVQRNSNITRIVDKLLIKGFAERKECPTNRRKMDLTITEAGLKKLKELDERVEAFHQPFIGKLSTSELETLKKLIIKLKS